MKKKVLLSIICSAYNEEKGISKLIESVILQNYNSYELILLNDGSKDNTYKIMCDYAKKYKNIIAIDKPNTGVADTRNYGIKIAKGKYITFADADDYYSTDFFEKIIPEIEKNNFELLYFNAKVMNHGKFMYNLISSKYDCKEFLESNGLEKYLRGSFCHQLGNVPWNKIYLKSVIDDNNLKSEINLDRGQDMVFNMSYAAKIKKYKYINEKLYYYNLDMNPMTTSRYFENSVKKAFNYYEPIKNICLDNDFKDYERYLALFFLRRFPGIIINEANNSYYVLGKSEINKYIFDKRINSLFKKIKISDFDFRLFICYVTYKFKLYNIIYYILWHVRHR